MPPKKGSSNGILSVLWWPAQLAGTVLFYPAQLFMYLVVDELGGEVIAKKKIVKQDGTVEFDEKRQNAHPRLLGVTAKDKDGGYPVLKDLVKYVKEYRYVLYDYFKWQRVKSPNWRCKGCSGGKGEYWCVDCSKRFCAQCAYNLHAPDSYAAVHSIEKIQRHFNTHCHFITPILDELIIGYLVVYCIRSPIFTEDYFTTQATCPMTNHLRSLASSVDPTFYYYYKPSLATWCDIEDSYLRFLLDGWARGVITETDNTLLVLQTLPQALLFNLVLTYALVPLLSVVYAVLINFFYTVECLLPRNVVLEKLEAVANLLDITDGIISGSLDLPPETQKRKRNSMDFMDAFNYAYQRKMKHVKYYYKCCVTSLLELAEKVIKAALVIRLGCCWLGLWPFLRKMCKALPGLRSIVEKHEVWYASAGQVIDEGILWHFGRNALRVMSSVMTRVPTAVIRISGAWILISAVVFIVMGAFCHMLVRQRRRFWAKGGPKAEGGLDFGQALELQKRQG